MSLFGFGKKKKENITNCCCGADYTVETMEQAEKEKNSSGIKILGGRWKSGVLWKSAE